MIINEALKKYIENNVFPQYDKNESGHGINHINYVIGRCFELCKDKVIDFDMLFTIAAYHDIGHHIDPKNHEIISAQIMYEDEILKEFFNEAQLKIIKEAIEDHRASLDREPRSIYGKLVSSADRNTSVDESLRRTYFYRIEHFNELSEDEIIESSYRHLMKKFGENGYANFFLQDEKYENYLKELRYLLNNKEEFIARQRKIISEIKREKAKQFAIKAHKGQVRKNEPDKPMIIHPISVGMLLEDFGYDDNVVSAGYLHDVVEDTKYAIQDIENEFGSDVANLVMGASEPDKSLSWKERKQHTIDEIKNLPLRNKLVVCADKINNLEDLMITFQKTGIRDFTRFKEGEEQQRWYYTSIYESLVSGQDEDTPIFQRLRAVLDIVFNNKKDKILDDIFTNNVDYYDKLISLNAQKLELKRLKALCTLSKPFVIEFCGTPRTGKTTILNNLYDFFKKGGFSVNLVEELTTSKYYKEVLYPQFENMSIDELNICIIREAGKQLQQAIAQGDDIIMIDRSLNDRAIWNYRRFKRNDMTEEQYNDITAEYSALSRQLIDMLVIGYTDPKTSLQRDYVNSLALEPRRFLNIENIEEYNASMEKSMSVFENSVSNIYRLDTTDITPRDSSVLIAENILPVMRKQYIKRFNETTNK